MPANPIGRTNMTEIQIEGDKDVEPLQVIWLQPWCEGCKTWADERTWCQDDAWGACDECGRLPVKYVIAPDQLPRIPQETTDV